MKKSLLFFVGLLIVGGFLFFIFNTEGAHAGTEAVVYKSPTCGCCVKWIPYFENEGFDVQKESTHDMDSIKEQYEIPAGMESCHTAIVEGYFIEGHVPMEVVNKLLAERPDIDGIALPGMPAGSPGMPGIKRGDFVVYAIKDGSVSEYVRL